jgi:hypothetical protein
MPDDPLAHHVEDQPEARVDPRIRTFIDHDLKERTGATISYARRQLEGTYWPIGLCIAWIMSADPDAAVVFYARHRVGTELTCVDGWGEAQMKLVRELEVGQVEALGIRPEGGERVAIGRHERVAIGRQEWIDLRIVQRGPYDEIRRPDRSLAYRDVRIEAATIRKIWPPETPAMKTVRERIANENACGAALLLRMKETPNAPIPKSMLKPQFPDVSKKAFDRLYAEAARESGCAAWSKGGRRRQASVSSRSA